MYESFNTWCGHKYVSTTERYQSAHLEELQERLGKHHLLGVRHFFRTGLKSHEGTGQLRDYYSEGL